MLCVGIVVADGNFRGVVALKIVAGIRSFKLVAAVPEVSMASPRYWVCRGCRDCAAAGRRRVDATTACGTQLWSFQG